MARAISDWTTHQGVPGATGVGGRRISSWLCGNRKRMGRRCGFYIVNVDCPGDFRTAQVSMGEAMLRSLFSIKMMSGLPSL